MKLRGTPIDDTPDAASFAGGAGGFFQGVLGGLGAFQQLEANNQQMQAELEDRRRKDRMLELSVRQADLQVQRFLEQKKENERRHTDIERQRGARAALNRTLFDSVMSDPTLKTPGQAAAQGAGYQQVPGFAAQQSPAGAQDYPPEWQAQDERLRAQADSGDITPEQYAQAVKLHAVSRGIALRQRATQDFIRSIERDTVPGPGGGSFWTSAGALGVEVNYDEKTGPDPLSQVPSIALARLQSGEPLESVALWYQGLKDTVETQKHQRLAVQGIAEEIGQQVAAKGQRLDARQRAEIATELARFVRGDGEQYRGFDDASERAVRAKIASIEANQVPIRVGSSIVYAPRETADQVQADLARSRTQKDPEMAATEQRLGLLSKFVGEFKAQPTTREVVDGKSLEVPNPESEEKQFSRWLERVKATSEALGLTAPRMSNVRTGRRAIDPTEQADAPSAAAQPDPAQTQRAMLPGTAGVKADSAPVGGAGNGAPARNSAPPAQSEQPVARRNWSALNEGERGALVERLRMEIQRPSSPTGVRDLLASLARQGIDVESLPADVLDQLAPPPPKKKRVNPEIRHRTRGIGG